MQKYPEDTVVSIEDFRNSGWRKAIDDCDHDNNHEIWHSLSDAARTAIEGGQFAEGKVLWLLADASSMMLKPSGVNEPFKPFIVREGMRSSIPEDFQPDDVELFAQIAEEVDFAWLQARLADLVWLLKVPRSPKHAVLAIDAYRTIPFDAETWRSGGRECWERAISLTKMIKAGAGDRMKEIEADISSAFDAATKEDGFLALWLSRILIENNLARDKSTEIAERLKSLAQIFDDEGEVHRAREFFKAAARWFTRAEDDTSSAEMTVCVAEGWVKEAIAQTSSQHPSYMVAASYYENAIQTYRTIPRRERSVYRVEERMAELHRYLNDSGQKSLRETTVISSSMDVSDRIERARELVRGKSVVDAVDAFANVAYGIRVKQLREISEKILREHLFSFFAATHRSRDGRVVAKRPGMSFDNAEAEENRQAVWAEMVRNYGLELGVIVQAQIWPAFEVLQLEHRLSEDDLLSITSNSPIVPSGRERLFAKALFAGYERDFIGALHLLVPQIEHMVRWHLKAANVKTTNLDKSGIENENGLSTLVDLPEVAQIFGEDLAFEIKALFCDAFGPNLRNELAHGLLDEEACQSIFSVYAWWLGFRLVFKAFWNARRSANLEPAPTEAPEDGQLE
jgi:Domain of unknown function (DUF4209)